VGPEGPRAVVFDLDDTLIDWWTAIARAASEVAEPEAVDRLLRVVRSDAWEIRDDGAVHRRHWEVREHPGRFWRAVGEPETAAGTGAVVAAFGRALRPRLFRDVLSALDTVAGRARIAVLTNSPHAAADLDVLGVSHRVDHVLSLDGALRKPALEGFAASCERLDCRPAEVMYVGDSPRVDVEPALEAGMRAAWIDRFDDPWTPPPGAVRLSSLEDLAWFLP
jgi:putative hydrolase of the HAD superfamily